MKNLALITMLCCAIGMQAQLRNADVYEVTEMDRAPIRNEIRIPDVGKYKVLKCDFHTHTVFSDGNVWPNMRVVEAWQDGLDAIAITDHIEYRPHKNVLEGDLNESYKIARKAATENGLIVIQGTEITRSKPLGHLNALFIEDANKMDVKDELAAIDEAIRQEAYIIWNHPGWPDDKSTFYPVHEQLIKEGKIHAVEVLNHKEYYPLVFDWFTKHNLAPVACSDVHDLIGRDYVSLRPITLVLAESRSRNSIRTALFERRTIAFFDNKLVGTPELLKSLVKSCIEVNIISDNTVLVTNLSDIPFQITGEGKLYILPGGKTIKMALPSSHTTYTIENCFVGQDKKLTVSSMDFM